VELYESEIFPKKEAAGQPERPAVNSSYTPTVKLYENESASTTANRSWSSIKTYSG